MADVSVVSCPGKVLIAGGYLVLDPLYSGLVVATASRFYTVVRPKKAASLDCLKITLWSPQFYEAKWAYECRVNAAGTNCNVRQTDQSPRNPFVQITLAETCRVLLALLGKLQAVELEVSVLGDNDFYSQDRNATDQPRPFRKLGTTLDNVHKTGLGSSAAMVTSLVGALMHCFGIDILAHRRLAHNLAQYAHSLAQGKIGSGFDVSAAIFGTQYYRRFDVSCLPSLSSAEELTSNNLLTALDPIQNPSWLDASKGGSVTPFALPPLTAIVLADVDAGSHTPSMVSKVLAWRNEEPKQAETLWAAISDQNTQLADAFGQMRAAFDSFPAEYREAISTFVEQREASVTASTSSLALLLRVRRIISTIRQLMREMGVRAAVPIEPPSQTALLDRLGTGRGVLGGGVPGAGGYDAVWVLVLAPDDSTVDDLEQMLETSTEANVRPLSRNARVYGRRSGGPDTSEKPVDGIRVEKLADVTGLREAIDLC